MRKSALMPSLFQEIPPHPDFIKIEEELLDHWYRDGIVKKYLHKNDKSPTKFSFLDGPITANNPMGVHHGRGRSYKDLWQKYHTMKGDRGRYQNGFDCQGLWVEVEVEKELGFKNKKEILTYGVEKFVQKCRERALKFAAVQTEQSKRLGMWADWGNDYYTMSDENNYAIWNFLKVCHQRGWIYKGNDSVPWCPRCETAISQHEMLTEDYKQVTHKAIYLELPITKNKKQKTKNKENEYLLIWTTTPWTIPANIAVAVDEKLEYALVKGKTGDKFWIAKDAVDRVFGSEHQGIVKIVKGKELVGLKYRGPFDDLPTVKKVAEEFPDKFHTVVPADPLILSITVTDGTGLVHTAVSAGSEDFKLGKKLGLPMVPVIADNADYLDGLGFLTGKNGKKNPALILDYLAERDKSAGENWVFEIQDYPHRYPACWRCKTELVWKVTDEWYIAMDKPQKESYFGSWSTSTQPKNDPSRFGRTSEFLQSKNPGPSEKSKTLREQMKEVTKQIRWIPGFGLDRELDWLNNMHDWLISKKNRFWGLALPIWECDKCGYFDVIGGKNELREMAVKGLDKFNGHSPHKPWIDEIKMKCDKCESMMSRIEPVGNPWLDAGIVPFSTLPEDWFPADFITESFPGQFKNWFYSLIVMSTVLAGKNPFKTVLGFESVVGEDGRPMHKSWGNAINFNEGAGKIGVDVMRWMYAKVSPTFVLPFGYKTGDEIRRRFLLILWNSFRFFVTNAKADGWKPQRFTIYDPSTDSGQVLRFTNVLDRWILARLDETIEKVTDSLDDYQSAPATEALEKFTEDFSTWYIRRSRDRVGPTAGGQDKENCYQAMYSVLTTLCRLLAPFMPFITDYMYMNLTGEESVHLAEWPEAKSKEQKTKSNQEIIDRMRQVREIVGLGHAQRKLAGIPLRQPLSSITVSGPAINPPFEQEFISLMADELNVEKVIFETGSSQELEVKLDTQLTSELKVKGRAREIIRTIQKMRKEKGVGLSDEISVELPEWPKEFEDQIKKSTLAVKIEFGKKPKLK
ncbi:class I tRNA ligase family protein [Candidatus Collierbacteria bacterium]|nr:class I tRNA ligase family protein [Candidatus Collierbacteria bacterium]